MHSIPRKLNSFFPASPSAMQAIPATEQMVIDKGFNNYSFIISDRIHYFNEFSAGLKKYFWPFTQLFKYKPVSSYRLCGAGGIYYLWGQSHDEKKE
jgi:hypothetical protein